LTDLIVKIKIDKRGRLTIPAKIRKKLHINPGDKLIIKVIEDNSIIIRKNPTKKQVFEELVGCIKEPSNIKPEPEMIKKIWKQNP